MFLKVCFSNSLIIHHVKTKKITSVKEVWIPGLLISIEFDNFSSPFSFIGLPNTSKFVKNTPLLVVFSTHFSVFGYPDETLSLVFDYCILVSEPFYYNILTCPLLEMIE